MKNKFITFSFAFSVFIVASYVGCSSANNESTLASLNDQNIKRLVNLYFLFQSSHEWRGPDDESEFKEFIKGTPSRKLKRIGIDVGSLDDLFINERDGKPFTIRYGVEGNMMGCSKPVVFETDGVRGKKMVGFLDMIQREVEPDEYEKLLSGEIETSAEPRRGN